MSTDRELNQTEKEKLIALARRTISDYVSGREVSPPDLDEEGLTFKRGAFVTLHKNGQLRGCIGNFVSDNPLAGTVQEMAKAAATADPRFPSVTPGEVDSLDLEISVLSPLKESRPEDIEVGKHGIYIISPRGRGVLLPQVATEYGWDRETFLAHTCMKAGLNPGCWRDPDVTIYTFSAQIFAEQETPKA